MSSSNMRAVLHNTEYDFREYLDETYPAYEEAGVSIPPSEILFRLRPDVYRLLYAEYLQTKYEYRTDRDNGEVLYYDTYGEDK